MTIDLVGGTFISKAGDNLSTTFHTGRRQPLQAPSNSFSPEGPYSALAANGNLCKLTKTETVKEEGAK